MSIGNAAPVVAHRDAAVAVQHQLDARGETGLRLVHRVVDDLERHVVQARAVIGVADIHAGAATHCIEAPQDRNGRGVIGVRIRLRRGVFGHADGRLQGLFGYSRYIAATACPGTGVSRSNSIGGKRRSGSNSPPCTRSPSAMPGERQEGLGVGAGDQRLRRQFHQRREQRRAAVRIEMHRRFVEQQHRREAARLGDQRGMAQDDADQQRLLLAGGRDRRRRAGHGIGQHHVGAVRADRRPIPPRHRGHASAARLSRSQSSTASAGARLQPLGDRAGQAHARHGKAGERRHGVHPRHQRQARRGGRHGVPRHRVLQPGKPRRIGPAVRQQPVALRHGGVVCRDLAGVAGLQRPHQPVEEAAAARTCPPGTADPSAA